MDSNIFDQTEFAENPEPRCPVVLVLDTSGSMQGKAITELNEGLRAFASALKADRLASLRVEVAVIAFGGKVRALDVRGPDNAQDSEVVLYNPLGLAIRPKVNEVPFDARQAFVTVDQFMPPTMDANGETPLGEAISRALALLRERKEIYKQNGLDYFRPWIFTITDGRPTDKGWESVAEQVRQEEARKGVIFYGVGVEGADLATLSRFSPARPPLKLKGLAFQDMFTWLSKSLSAITHSRPGDQAPLPPVGWGSIDTSHS
ncbi:MAG: VWA domain-containing protein [Chloroflexi bacterium]|nr:MAG: VWA domain-containing protein [Chloroflexota bacterium]